jgi:outer membrane receptor protein involved in Fe transport
MFRFYSVSVPLVLAVAVAIALPCTGQAQAPPAADAVPPADTSSTDTAAAGLEEIVVTAQRLNDARSGIQTQTGASTYTIDSEAILAMPGGENAQLNQVLLQAPDVVQDSFGQIHVRGDHNDLQYRLNGIILPEGISVFSQTLSPRLISSMSLITGALPAEYGLRTAGIIDLTTSSGLLQPGGTISIYGGSHDTIEPAFEYGGSAGRSNYFVTADLLHNDLGIENPANSADALHDHSTQGHAFGYFEDILGSSDRLSLILGLSNDQFQIPNQAGLQPTLGLNVNGQTSFLSNNLNENQHELAQYAIVSWQHADGPLNWQSSLSGRYTSLSFQPDWTGDLLYNGISQAAFKSDVAFAWQTDAAYTLNASHTLRAGVYLQHDTANSNTTSQVLTTTNGVQNSLIPLAVADDGSQTQWMESVYVQDEWKALSNLTVNYGLRADQYNAYTSGGQLSPRLNLVWELVPGSTVHGGYSRYFTPPPFELINSETFSKFANTTAIPPGTVTTDTPPVAERANYYDFGVEQKLLGGHLTLGIDSFYKSSTDLLDEGQFGAPIILTPFNYLDGRIEGIEFTGNYSVAALSLYGNLAFQSAKGRDIVSSQFNFTQQQLDYLVDNYIHLDHEERVSASSGISYLWHRTRMSADLLFGTGLREDQVLPGGFVIPNGDHTPSYAQVNLGLSQDIPIAGTTPLSARVDVINLFDKEYEIRSGNGIGVFAPQYGPRRGLFVGLSKGF